MSNCKNEKLCKKTSIGGQALMEGIMMRGPQKSAMAVRRPNGEIFFEESENAQHKRPGICRLPIIRGVFGFIDSMTMGYKYLMRSAEISCEEEDTSAAEQTSVSEQTSAFEQISAAESVDSENAEAAADIKPNEAKAGKAEKKKDEAIGKGTMTVIMVIATVLGVALAIGLFVWLPTFLYTLLGKVMPRGFADNRYLRSVFEGVLKIAVLVLYMALVSLLKDIRRTFMYHGAEHKTIFCYEHGLPLTVENVRGQSRFHPRCGTSFLILMLLVSILVGMLIPPEFAGIDGTVYTFIRAGIKILLIPIIMGIGYEILKFAGKHENLFTRIISAPGMWLQHITVKEPTDDMIECAIMAFEAVIPENEKA